MPLLKTIGKYEIVDALGTGGMGAVYRAFDPTLERIVAVKVLQLDSSEVSQAELSERFRNEARAVARLNHPAIVAIFDYDDQDPAGAYIAMEYVHGCALDEYVKQHAELHIGDMISAMQQVLAALDYAHRHDVVHRDVKPSNLLVARDGMVKITDFGIAKIGPRSQKQTGLLVGTPQYMAPEQYMGGQIDHRCDIHAAAVVLYELMTGAAPFSGTAAEVMHQVCYQSPAALSAVNPRIPAAFDAVVAKALEKNPADRYATASEFNDALRSVWQSISKNPISPSLSKKARVVTPTMRRVPVSVPPSDPMPAQEVAAAAPGPPPAPPSAVAVPEQALRKPPVAPTQVILPNAPAAAAPIPAAAPPPLAVPAAPQQTQPETGAHQGTLAAWSREQLAEIERQLTQIVGPVAKVLVRSAAANTANRQQLYAMLADHLHTPEERRRFLAAEPAGGATNPATSTAPAAAPGVHARQPITPETLQRASQLLSRYLGPIASILTKKAAQTAVDESHLYSLLAGKLSDAAEQERFMREVRRGTGGQM
ncbi:MAG: serine/threonine-protein kinase [Steroidobacteraceae bacterium]